MPGIGGPRLNREQARAVQYHDGPLLVVAGAGTGKTRVIVERFVRLIDTGVKPQSIIALTFTEKAANEMLDRVNELRGGFGFDTTIATYNAYGEQILRRFAADIGLNSNLKLLGEASQIVFLREHLDELALDYYAPVSNPDGHLQELVKYFSRLKQSVVRSEEYIQYAQTLPATNPAEKLERQRHLELADAFASYIKLCRQANVIDYDDQLYVTLELFAKRPNVLRQLQSEISYVLVDEFQDTNPMQSDFIDALVHAKSNLMVVGDDDQSIYGWRGATLDNILDFKKRYPKTTEIVLTENYRSTQAILDAAYRLIQHNNPHRLEAQHGIRKRLSATRPGRPPKLNRFHTLNDELTFVVKDIEGRLKAGQDPGEIAVLVRGNQMVARLHDLFNAYGIEHVVAGISHELYRQPIIQDVLTLLKTVADPTNNAALYHTLTGSIFRFSAQELSSYNSLVRQQHESLISLLTTSEEADIRVAGQTILDWHDQSTTQPVSRLLYDVYERRLKTWLLEQLEQPALATGAEQIGRDLQEFFGTLKDFERTAERTTTATYVENIPALVAAGESVTDDTMQLDNQSVSIMTIHKAKGLEWPTVYVVDLTAGGFPTKAYPSGLLVPETLSRTTSPADDHLLEERRLMYVAMTRAADELILSYAERRVPSGQRRQPSPFIAEALGELQTKLQPAGQPELPSDQRATARAGKVALPKALVDGDYLVLTASQIETFLYCPYDFYYRYVLALPQEPSAAALVGQTLHELIAELNRSYLSDHPLTLKQAQTRLVKNWPKVGFLSAKHRQRALNQAQITLKTLWQREAKAHHHPELIEQPFQVVLPEQKVKVVGRFDAIYIGKETEIRDYKTGAVSGQDRADRKAKDSPQLTIYALAWQKLKGMVVDTLSLDYVSSGIVANANRSQRRLDNMASKIGSIAQKIRSSDFAPGYQHDHCLHPPVTGTK